MLREAQRSEREIESSRVRSEIENLKLRRTFLDLLVEEAFDEGILRRYGAPLRKAESGYVRVPVRSRQRGLEIENLEILRKDRGFSQRELTKRVDKISLRGGGEGVHHDFVGAIERSGRLYRVGLLPAISLVLDVDVFLLTSPDAVERYYTDDNLRVGNLHKRAKRPGILRRISGFLKRS